jgi:NADH:ubiquinone oxidoreductase subunit F (NADH-binding)
MTLVESATTTVMPPLGPDRLLSASDPGLSDHLARFGALPPAAPGLVDALRESGLSGRGGAAFPTWRKLASAAGAGIVVVANGAEGEPLSAKDAVLLQRAPHLVIDGLLTVAQVLGAARVVIYAESAQLPHVARALRERTDASGVVLTEAPHSFIAGEASAVIGAVSSGRPIPFDHRMPLSAGDRGLPPTVVQNVETLANIALIARFGAAWFRSVGTADEPGSRLVTLCGDVPLAGVVEVAGGVSLEAALSRSGVRSSAVRAVLVGGYHGAWVPGAALGTALSREGLAPFGAAPAAGVLMVLGTGKCGLRSASSIVDYLAAQSTRQCGPCVNGLPALASTLTAVAGLRHDSVVEDRVRELAALVIGRGSCHHPDGTARFVLSTLTVFAEDVRAHRHGSCREVER